MRFNPTQARLPRSFPRLEILENRDLPSVFGPVQTFATGAAPAAVAVGDFNHDGSLDLAIANSGDATVSILLGNGAGGFTPTAPIAVGFNPESIAVGDFNNDGNLDLAVANEGSNTVSILLGNGAGGFVPPLFFGSVSVGTGPVSVAAGDFNHDGNTDLAVANSIDNTVSILLGHGNGIFTVNQTVPVPLRPLSVAVGQFFPGGNIDLVVANRDGGAVSILLGDGSGEFVPIDVPSPNSPASVVVADFNHDGNQDLAVGNEDDSLNVFPGTGDGFGNPTTLNGGSAPTGGPAFPAVGDFNRDGNLDLAVANEGANTVSVLNGDGNGGFAAPVSFSVGTHPLALAVGDFNGDGAPDLAVVNQGDNTVSILLNQYYHTTTSLTASANPALPGQLVTIQATVSPDVPQSTLPTGVVTFMDGETILGSGTVPANGIVSLVTTFGSTGFHSLSAVYQGDAYYFGSSASPLNLLVNQAGTAVSLSSSANPGITGQAITFTASVSALENAPGFGQPTGIIFFQEDSFTQLGSVTLANGLGALTTAALTPGNHTIVAYYTGDNQFTSSVSSAFSIAINTPPPVVTSISPNSLVEGSPAFTLTINGSSFLSGASVVWNGTPLTVTDLTATQIQATVPGSLVAQEGSARVAVSSPGSGSSLLQTFTVADAPLTTTNMNISVVGNKNFSGTVASFTDANGSGTAADFSAVISWDNGTATLGTISGTGPFTVTASHLFGAFANARHITVAILDAGGSTATAIDTVIDPIALSPNQAFVAQLYQDLLQRPVDDSGLAAWTSLLDQGVSRTQVARSIENSAEYLDDEVQTLYQHYLRRAADSSGLVKFTQFLAKGGTLEQAAALVAGSSEYMESRGSGTSFGFLSALYEDVLNRPVDPGGQAIFSKALANGATPSQVAAAIFASSEYQQDLVASYYQTYLGRSVDQSGLEVFVAALRGGSRGVDVLAAILGSDEYFGRT